MPADCYIASAQAFLFKLHIKFRQVVALFHYCDIESDMHDIRGRCDADNEF